LEDDRMGYQDPKTQDPHAADPDTVDPDIADPDIECRVIDIRGVSLDQLAAADDSVLALAISRILRAAENPDEAAFAFQQSI
jgi:FXSXX-COOH protein